MTDTFMLHMELNVFGDPEVTQMEKVYKSLAEANADIFEFVQKSGEPNEGQQTITIVLVSNRK